MTRNYRKGADRSYHGGDAAADTSDRQLVKAMSDAMRFPKGAKWWSVWLNGVLLSYGHNKKAAERHAERCGGEVREGR